MKQLQPVIWTKGTFLTPQHLQTQDRFIEDTLNFRLQALKFCAWGFNELVINQELLSEGQLVVCAPLAFFLTACCSMFRTPIRAALQGTRRMVFDPATQNLDIYLAIPGYRQRGLNESVAQRDGSSRYSAEVTSFRDENTGATEKPVQVARKNLRLLVEGESREGCSALRIANVEKTKAGTFALNHRFVPPLIDINASEYLAGLLRGLIEILSARSTQLSGGRRQKIRAWRISPHPISQISGCSTQ